MAHPLHTYMLLHLKIESFKYFSYMLQYVGGGNERMEDAKNIQSEHQFN
jgi:hypothetical protein